MSQIPSSKPPTGPLPPYSDPPGSSCARKPSKTLGTCAAKPHASPQANRSPDAHNRHAAVLSQDPRFQEVSTGVQLRASRAPLAPDPPATAGPTMNPQAARAAHRRATSIYNRVRADPTIPTEVAIANLAEAAELFLSLGQASDADVCHRLLVRHAERPNRQAQPAAQRMHLAQAQLNLPAMRQAFERLPQGHPARANLAQVIQLAEDVTRMLETFQMLAAFAQTHRQKLNQALGDAFVQRALRSMGLQRQEDTRKAIAALDALFLAWEEALESGKFGTSERIYRAIWHGNDTAARIGLYLFTMGRLPGPQDLHAPLERIFRAGRNNYTQLNLTHLLKLEQPLEQRVELFAERVRLLAANGNETTRLTLKAILRVLGESSELGGPASVFEQREFAEKGMLVSLRESCRGVSEPATLVTLVVLKSITMGLLRLGSLGRGVVLRSLRGLRSAR